MQATSQLQPTWMSSLIANYEGDDFASALLSQFALDNQAHAGYCIKSKLQFNPSGLMKCQF